VKTTLEIPDFLFHRVKSVAAERGIPLRQFVTEAVQEKLKTISLWTNPGETSWQAQTSAQGSEANRETGGGSL